MRLEEVAEVVGGGYCRLQMPLKLALAVRETVAGRRLGAMEPPPLSNASLDPPMAAPHPCTRSTACSRTSDWTATTF